jgi:formamidopyrimidine-DNA glycosylase
MPELPEVETARRAMAAHLVGRTVVSVRTSGLPLRAPLPQAGLAALCGARFAAARRRAKFLLLDTDDGRVVLIHLGMSGNLRFRPPGQPHDHVVFELDCGPPLVLADPRRFGLILVLDAGGVEQCPHLRDLGIEPLEPGFDAAYLRQRCRGRSRPIKNAIMDARVVAGIGNIYASESLFRAGIRPGTAAGKLSLARLERLVRAVKEVLTAAIREGGTTVSSWEGEGTGGHFQQRLAVYGRAGDNCVVCDRPVVSQVLAGRSTYFCRHCQR